MPPDGVASWPMLSNQSCRFTAIHLPLGIDVQTLSHKITQLSRDDDSGMAPVNSGPLSSYRQISIRQHAVSLFGLDLA
jgi:hypothetical protein